MRVQSLSHVQLFATPWTVAHKAPPSLGQGRFPGGEMATRSSILTWRIPVDRAVHGSQRVRLD